MGQDPDDLSVFSSFLDAIYGNAKDDTAEADEARNALRKLCEIGRQTNPNFQGQLAGRLGLPAGGPAA